VKEGFCFEIQFSKDFDNEYVTPVSVEKRKQNGRTTIAFCIYRFYFCCTLALCSWHELLYGRKLEMALGWLGMGTTNGVY